MSPMALPKECEHAPSSDNTSSLVDSFVIKSEERILGSTIASQANHAFVLERQGQFRYESRSIPSLRSEEDVLIRVVATGLCGSDVHYWQHGRIGDYVVQAPIVLGHESAGIVERCGSHVKRLAVGDRVALEPGAGCKSCSFCRTGRYNLCESMRFAATPPYDGTLSTFYTLPEDCCYLLPPHVSFEEGALVEPLAVAVHCCKLAGVGPGSSVLVFGAGPIGLLCCAVSRAFGASSILCADIVQSRLDFAQNYAATRTYLMHQDEQDLSPTSLKIRVGLPQGSDIVIEATGAPSCVDCGVKVVKRGGTFVQAGLGNPRINFPIGQVCDKEMTLKGSFRYGPGDYDLAVELLRMSKVSVQELITHRFNFSEAIRAFETVSSRKEIKCVIRGPSNLT